MQIYDMHVSFNSGRQVGVYDTIFNISGRMLNLDVDFSARFVFEFSVTIFASVKFHIRMVLKDVIFIYCLIRERCSAHGTLVNQLFGR